MFQILLEKKKRDWNSYLQIIIISAHTFVCGGTEISAAFLNFLPFSSRPKEQAIGTTMPFHPKCYNWLIVSSVPGLTLVHV